MKKQDIVDKRGKRRNISWKKIKAWLKKRGLRVTK
jgi:hypothetical protein